MWLILSASSVHCGPSAGIPRHEPNQSLHSDGTATRHLLLRALWISEPHPKSTPAVPLVSSNVRQPLKPLRSSIFLAMVIAGANSCAPLSFEVHQDRTVVSDEAMGSLRATIIDSRSNTPIVGARLELQYSERVNKPGWSRTTISDPEGRVEVRFLVPGKYLITADHSERIPDHFVGRLVIADWGPGLNHPKIEGIKVKRLEGTSGVEYRISCKPSFMHIVAILPTSVPGLPKHSMQRTLPLRGIAADFES